jgi:hypothetical protein
VPAGDGSFHMQFQGTSPAMIWLELRPDPPDGEGGSPDPFEGTLAAYLGTVDVPALGHVARDIEARDLLTGSIDVLVRLHGKPASNMRVTLFAPNHARDMHDSWPTVVRDGQRYVGGITILTGDDGHARLANMIVGEWGCYVRPLDRSWGCISSERAIVRSGGATLFGVDADPAPRVLQFVSGDSRTMSPAGVLEAPLVLAGVEVWWKQRSPVGLIGVGHARTDADGALAHEFPDGEFEFGLSGIAVRDPNFASAHANSGSVSRVTLAEAEAVPRQIYLRVP